MEAVTIEHGRVAVTRCPDLEPGYGQLLVEVRAAGVNGMDLMVRDGRLVLPSASGAMTPGFELAGVVASCGPGTSRFTPGAAVLAVVDGGAHAEYAVLSERVAMPLPAEVLTSASDDGWTMAGGLPEAFMTAHDALFTQAGLSVGERVCVHGAAGGVGLAAVQLALAAGAQVVATVRARELRDLVGQLGAEVIDPAHLTRRGPFDVILELVGAPNMTANIDAIGTRGRILVIGVGAGAMAELNLRELMNKRVRLCASTLRTRSPEEKADAARRWERHVAPLLVRGVLGMPVDSYFPLAEAERAFERYASRGKFGKVVLRAT